MIKNITSVRETRVVVEYSMGPRDVLEDLPSIEDMEDDAIEAYEEYNSVTNALSAQVTYHLADRNDSHDESWGRVIAIAEIEVETQDA
jgi:hypothetical protein